MDYLKYISQLTVEELYDFWAKSTFIDKNKDIRHFFMKRDIFYIGRIYCNFTRKQLADKFKVQPTNITVQMCLAKKHSSSVEDTVKELGYWKYKQLKKHEGV